MPSASGAKITAVLLGMLFIVSGCLKTIKISTALHREMLKVFKNLTDVCPLKLVGFNPSPVVYMQVVGVFELISGTALAFGTLLSQKVSCVGLMCMMVLTSYSQIALRDVGSVGVIFH
uniref:Uncharacterized protein ZMYM6NB n=1 Tax=Schistocephalus solidus TaxID=70667 RepID=A0A0X3NT42_SCHSO